MIVKKSIYFIRFIFLQSCMTFSMHIEVTIGQNHDWAVSDTNQSLIYRKIGKPEIIKPSTPTPACPKQYVNLAKAIIAGREVARKERINHTLWLLLDNGTLQQVCKIDSNAQK